VARREEFAERATDYVLENGLIGLSLRPLAAALGTSDRMLLYHFGTRDDLVATVLRLSNDRAVAQVEALRPARDIRAAVRALWAAMNTEQLQRCQRTYVEAAALGLFGSEPYAGVVREANDVWVRAVAAHLVRAGARRSRAERATALLDAAFTGFLLDQPLEGDRAQRQAVRDLTDAVVAVAQGSA
jgi:AcrR family transcriptional regulator